MFDQILAKFLHRSQIELREKLSYTEWLSKQIPEINGNDKKSDKKLNGMSYTEIVNDKDPLNSIYSMSNSYLQNVSVLAEFLSLLVLVDSSNIEAASEFATFLLQTNAELVSKTII